VTYLLGCAALLTAEFILLLAYFTVGALKLRRLKPPLPPLQWPSVSVVVPLRNEERHAPATLAALAKQDYPGSLEILLIDDRSTDQTATIIETQASSDPRFRAFHIPIEAPTVPSPKKRALAKGFTEAQGDILMTTDADCLPGPHWVKSLASHFQPQVGIVQGPKRIRGSGHWLHVFQEQEVFGLVSIEAATFALGHPMMASAPSLAYRRSLYQTVGGFQDIEDTVSGDDDLLVRKMVQVPGYTVTYAPQAESCVTTEPVNHFWPMVVQRARWASNGAHYEQKGFVALLLGLYLFYCWLVLSPFLAGFGLIPWFACLLPWSVKIICNGIFLGLTARSLDQKKVWRRLIPCELIHVPVVVVAVVMGHLGLYRWK
jgi:cellulose synthase/poly-beta-1,6-N-acetylglucosamine synthase-like glycosyltransferase